MSSSGERIVAGLEEALRYARGESTGAVERKIERLDVARIRNGLGLSQTMFAHCFGISVGTLRNWEQGVRSPDGPARVLLRVIEREPQAVRRALSISARKRKAPAPAKRA